MKNKDDLLKTMEAHGACEEATLYVLTHDSDSALEIGLTCSYSNWLAWLLAHEGVSLTDFVGGCAERAGDYAAANDAARYAEDAAKSADRYVADYAANAAEAAAAASYAEAAAAAGFYAYASPSDSASPSAVGYRIERKIQLETLRVIWAEWCES